MSQMRRIAWMLAWLITPLIVETGVWFYTHQQEAPLLFLRPSLFPDRSGKYKGYWIGDTFTKVYDIRDLIITIPDFTDEPDFGPPPTPPTAIQIWLENHKPKDWILSGYTRQEHEDGIIQWVEGCIEGPDSRHAIRCLQGQLIVTATRENHARIIRQIIRIRLYRWLLENGAAFYLPWLGLTVMAMVYKRIFGRTARWRRAGLCHRCGYDLRASNDRCPECGSTIAVSRIASSK